MKKTYIILVLIFIFFVHFKTNAQDTLNIEKKFEIAQTFAFEGERDTARALLYQILAKKPDFIDAKLLIARTHAWDAEYDSARYHYRQVLNKKPNYKEAIEGLIDVQNWDKKPDSAIHYCNLGIKYYPKDNSFAIKKAKVYLDKGNLDEAYKQLMAVKAKDSTNEEVIKLLDDDRFILQNDKIQVEYNHEWFDQPYTRRWSLYALSYTNKSSWGTFVGRVYSGNNYISSHSTTINNKDTLITINDNGSQFEIEAYPRLDDLHYLYVGVSLSSDYFFPKSRIGLEIYRKLNATSEVSLGMRRLNFNDSKTTVSKVNIYTASYSKYINDFWLYFRVYYTDMSSLTSWSYSFHGRKYYKNPETYLFAELIFGTSPTEQNFYINNVERNSFSSQKFRIGFQKLFRKRWTFYAAWGLEDAEYLYKGAMDYHLINSIEFRLGYFLPFGK